MTSSEFETMLQQLARFWSRGDYDRLAEHFTDPLFYSDALNYSFYDRSSLINFFRDDGGHEQICVFHNYIFDDARHIGVAEYTYSGHFTYHGTVWIELEGDKICVWREYQHRSDTSHAEFWKLDERDLH